MLGYQGSDSENATDCFFRLFFFSIRPTDPISGNAFDGKGKKRGGGGGMALYLKKALRSQSSKKKDGFTIKQNFKYLLVQLKKTKKQNKQVYFLASTEK